MRLLLYLIYTLCVHATSSTIVSEFLEALEEFRPSSLNVGSSGQAKQESLDEKLERFRVFKNTKNLVETINHDNSIPFMATINEFSVMTETEKATHTGLNISALPMEEELYDRISLSSSMKLQAHCPPTVNWIKRNAQPPIKQQGSCGACWAYAATSALEGAYYATTGQLTAFSDQELLECSYEMQRGKDGCKGGWPNQAFEYVKYYKRLAAEKSNPYRGVDGQCSWRQNGLVSARLTGYRTLKQYQHGLKGATAAGVVAVAILVKDSFFSYQSGLYVDRTACPAGAPPNHAVTVVGYGTNKAGQAYWRVRNSWGAEWGTNGYILMSRDEKNNCGIENYGFVPVMQCAGQCSPPKFSEDGPDDDADGGGEQVCEDKKKFCPKYKSHCKEGKRYHAYMIRKCKKTCKKCQGGGGGGGGGDGSCPGGTVRCRDGVCRHSHMCH